MGRRWQEPIRKTGELSVFAGKSVTGSWARVFKQAIEEFNTLSRQHNFGVVLIPSLLKPSGRGRPLSGANVQFEAIDGTVTFDSYQQDVDVTVFGTDVAGFTAKVATGASEALSRIGQAFCCVPIRPRVAEGHTGSLKHREAGDPIKLILAVHELMHAAGLADADHTKPPDQDLFFDPNSAAPGSPLDSNPNHDFLEMQGTGKSPLPRLPPLRVNSDTAAKLRALW